jgi:predicted HAD superfamily Cof-like phosphohydrolase
MRNEWTESVKKFHDAFGVATREQLGYPDNERQRLRYKLIDEEVNKELLPAIAEGSLVEIADGCADAIVVILGTCLEYGIPIEKVFAEVMRANMSKLGEDDKPIYREDGKVMKGPNYTPPDVRGVLVDSLDVERHIA